MRTCYRLPVYLLSQLQATSCALPLPNLAFLRQGSNRFRGYVVCYQFQSSDDHGHQPCFSATLSLCFRLSLTLCARGRGTYLFLRTLKDKRTSLVDRPRWPSYQPFTRSDSSHSSTH